MENAADALKMAGAVLIFVLALSIIIFAFSQARQTSDTILTYKDRETMYIQSNYYYDADGQNQSERVVGFETVIPAIFRAYLENYKIVFVGLEKPIYKIKSGITGEYVPKYTIDLERNVSKNYPNANVANDQEKVEFIKGILYQEYINGSQDEFEKKFFVKMEDCKSIYAQLKNKKITESIRCIL